MFIQDLLNPQGNFASAQYLSLKYNLQVDVMTLNSIVSAIPTKWKKLLKTDNNIANYKVFLDCKININERKTKLQEVTTKDLYIEISTKKAERPTSEKKWQDTVGLNYDENTWSLIYRNPYRLTREAKLIAFHFKITHRIIACKKNLHTWKVENNNICDHCRNAIDEIEHFLVACPQTLQFWNTLFTWWKSSFQTFIHTDTYDIIFGLVNENEDVFIDQFNFMLLQGTYYIYKSKIAKTTIEFYEYLLHCKNKLILEKELMADKQKSEHFERKWQDLLSAL
jgi:hypothetical protein